MRWLSYLYPQTILITGSVYNKHIRINLEAGKYKLLVNGSRESGEYIRKLWQYMFDTLGVEKNRGIKKILVLGVAGGTVIHLVHKLYPQAHIIGIEIDPVMIRIGKKYFGLESLKTLQIKQADAQLFVGRDKGIYDLILIDLFFGREIPSFVHSDVFIRDIKKRLSSNGVLLVNYLREKEYKQNAQAFELKLKIEFPNVRSADKDNNRFFKCF